MATNVVGNHDRCSACGLVHYRYNQERGIGQILVGRGNDRLGARGPEGSEHRAGILPFRTHWNTADRRDGGYARYVVAQ